MTITRTRADEPALVLLSAALSLCLAGCAVTRNAQQIETLGSDGGPVKVLLMPPDIRYYLVTAGGVPEPHAEWTEAARRNFSAAVQKHAENIGTELEVLDDKDMRPEEIRYQTLHEAVGHAVMAHHFGKSKKLPSKKGAFDWSLGPGVREIAEEHDADYALFAFYRDEQASGGRLALTLIVAAAAGYLDDKNAEHGFASLVDLKSGDLVWFNVVSAGSGELRDAEGAQAAVNTLFRNMPSNRTQ
jgi:hypothetical protein